MSAVAATNGVRTPLAEWMAGRGIGDDDLARAIECSRSTVSRLRRGCYSPSPALLARLRGVTAGAVDLAAGALVFARAIDSSGAPAGWFSEDSLSTVDEPDRNSGLVAEPDAQPNPKTGGDAQPSSENWAIVEIFGHRRHVGIVSEVERYGAKMCRIDVPGPEGTIEATFLYGGGSIFSETPVTAERGRAMVAQMRGTAPPALLGLRHQAHYADEFEDR